MILIITSGQTDQPHNKHKEISQDLLCNIAKLLERGDSGMEQISKQK